MAETIAAVLIATAVLVLGVMLVSYLTERYRMYLRTLALEYAGYDAEIDRLPSPQALVEGLVYKGERLENAAKFIRSAIESHTGDECDAFDELHEALVTFIKCMRDGGELKEHRHHLDAVLSRISSAARMPGISLATQQKAERWDTEIREWMEVVHHVFQHEVIFGP